MKKFTWIIFIAIIFIWLAISTYWTGRDNTDKPKQINPIPVYPTEMLKKTEVIPATPSAIITPIVSTGSGNSNLKY